MHNVYNTIFKTAKSEDFSKPEGVKLKKQEQLQEVVKSTEDTFADEQEIELTLYIHGYYISIMNMSNQICHNYNQT